ncbi:hypothetical protein [Lysinibacillus sp. LZ02]|uniref:hypothetical protein n=1 Tax=Lysinibacillus sp. LZ02 TaxID=3420668 RepID=UPI003D362611
MWIDKVVQSPITITVYYEMLGEPESWEYDDQFKLLKEEKQEVLPNSGQTMVQSSYIRFNTNTERIDQITLIPFYVSGYEGNQKTDVYEVLLTEQAIEIELN